MSAESVVEAKLLAKSYGTLKALDQVNFQVRPGEIFGFIGADGAGKTTTFKIISGVLAQGSGEISVLGTNAPRGRLEGGISTQPFSLYMDLSIDENLSYAGGLRLVPPKEYAERRERYFKLFDLYRFTDRLAGRLSGGMKQKLALTAALIADPELLLLDEPTTGVDPVTRRDFWDALTSLATEGMSIIVATPYLDEAETLPPSCADGERQDLRYRHAGAISFQDGPHTAGGEGGAPGTGGRYSGQIARGR